MNKQLKKAVEAELYTLINGALSVRNKIAAADIVKQVKESVKSLAKKFVKHIPKAAPAKKSKKAGTPKKKTGKKAAPTKAKSRVRKVSSKAKATKTETL